ncbi:putative 54S ribosomal protein L51, mitochondrial-like [Capsicum annuum]|nr:putative 54S ribosomal protein L51, mitochondrial-like [Capsicum annuum]
MKSLNTVSVPDPKSRSCLCSVVLIVALICAVYFTGSALMAKDSRAFSGFTVNRAKQNGQCGKCEKTCRPFGSEALPEGIVSKTSNFEMRPLWGDVEKKSPHSVNLLGIAVGIKQKELVNKIVKKFLEHDFVVMLFHYDGVVDEWNDLDWSSRAIHISAMNQTKWWFAKRFLHPDIVSEYDYIFLWDEDLGVENFHPDKYISIVREEGLEISQPALDARKSEVHHHITVRRGRSKVHRWVEMMAPVFSKAAWRCAWYMVQNDLIHAWGLDMKLGYCAQANLNNFLPTFRLFLVIKELDHSLQGKNLSDSDALAAPVEKFDNRSLNCSSDPDHHHQKKKRKRKRKNYGSSQRSSKSIRNRSMITGSGTAHPDRCWDEERSALLELQANMMSSNGGHLGLWETYNEIGYSDCCSWYWVKCNLTTDRVVELDLREARLGSGVGWSFNATLFLPFKSLQVLLLSENFVAGWNKNEGFDKLSQLTNLKVLVLGLNYLPFPNVLSPLCWISSLEVLILASGQMGSIGFHSLKNYTMPTDEGITEKCPGLRYLRALVLTGYGINDISLLSALGLGTDTGLSNLEKLDLTSNGFNSTIFSSLKHFPSLKHLDLKNNDIVGNIEMSGSRRMSSLRNLQLGDSDSNSTKVVKSLKSFSSLKGLWFLHSDLSASATAYALRNMSTLEYLNLDGSYLNENFLSSIGQMTSLKVLNMAFGGNYGILPNQGWCELQNIQELSFMNNNFEGTLPSCLVSFNQFVNHSKLTYLSVGYNTLTTDTEFKNWIPNFQLKFFAIEGCVNRQKLPSFLHYQHDLIILAIDHNQLPGNFPTWLLENNTRLAGLYARDNAFIGPLKLPSSRHLYLEQLDVSNNELSGRVPANISSAFPNLNILNMSLNLFEGPIPSDIGGFHLLALDLSHNFLSGGVPRDLAIGSPALF